MEEKTWIDEYLGYQKIIKEKYNFESSVNEEKYEDTNQLCSAIQHSNIKMIKQLLNSGFQVSEPHTHFLNGRSISCFFTVMILACESDNADLLKLFLHNGADPNQKMIQTDFSFHFPLNYSSYMGCLEISNLLIKFGASLTCNTYRYGSFRTCLTEAIKSNNQRNIYEMVCLLLKHNADPNIAESGECLSHSGEIKQFSDTPLLIAINSGDIKLACLLLKYGAKVTKF
jgi:ankyrin repeat protein